MFVIFQKRVFQKNKRTKTMNDLSPIEFKKRLPDKKAILGIDYGTKRIGVAISDLLWMTATPLKIVEKKEDLDKIILTRDIGGFVVGLPKQMNGQEGAQAELTRQWAEKLQKKYALPILFWDERLSSSAVSRLLIDGADVSRKRQKEVLDKMAASYILQGALDLLSRL